jgi:two-component system OmpR family response regulator
MIEILLIDDDIQLSAMLVEYLRGEGFSVTVSGNGEDGARLALSKRFAAVILDIMLPRVNGVEVLRRIRAGSTVPVIMLTARGDDVDRVVGLELGADDYIAKPYYPRELIARLRAVLRRTQAPELNGVLTMGRLRLDARRRSSLWQERSIDLTATEFALLEALLGAGEAVATKEDPVTERPGPRMAAL